MFDPFDPPIRKAEADIAVLKKQIEWAREKEESHRSSRVRLEAKLAKVESFLAVLEMSEYYKAPPKPVVPVAQDAHKEEFDGLPLTIDQWMARTDIPEDPPMAEMIRECLRKIGEPCRPIEVVDRIQAKWGEEVNAASVKTLMWRMAKAGELTHSGTRYSLPQGTNGHAGGR